MAPEAAFYLQGDAKMLTKVQEDLKAKVQEIRDFCKPPPADEKGI